MSRPLCSRILSLALSLWVTLFMSGSELIVRCATHGGGLPSATAAGHSATAATETVTGYDHADHDSAPADQQTGHNCSCQGPGCCPPAVAVLPGAAVPMAHVVAVHEARAISTLDRLENDTDYLHPYATAPPTVALASAA